MLKPYSMVAIGLMLSSSLSAARGSMMNSVPSGLSSARISLSVGCGAAKS